jgi:large subunit ribosomal protein L28
LFLRKKDESMSRVCYFTGKRTVAGRSISRRGKAKYLGGVGRKVTGISKRKFKPNIQKVRAVVDGKVCRIKVVWACFKNHPNEGTNPPRKRLFE